MKIDLHIHSALSPCGSDDMTPNNIINMAKICELDMISVCDHNTLGQQVVLGQVAKKLDMKYLYGVEVQSVEDVHVCGYFIDINDAQKFDIYLKKHLLPIKNDVHFFGNQYLFDENDEVIGCEDILLIQSTMVSINDIAKKIHEYHGIVSLAHVCDKSNSILTQLGFIPPNLEFDIIEIKNEKQKEMVMKMHPWIKDVLWIKNSDAHYLQDIGIYEDNIDEDEWNEMWRKRL